LILAVVQRECDADIGHIISFLFVELFEV